MTVQRFIQLWTHRYHKFSHISEAHLRGYLAWVRFTFLKYRLKKNQQLIAIIRTEHFGDIVAAEPISRYVKSLYPEAYVVWFVKPVFHELVDNNPAVDEIFLEFCVTQRRVLLETEVFDKVFELQFHNNNHCLKCQVFTENTVAVQRGINVHTYLNFGNLLEIFAKTGDLIPVNEPFPADDHPQLYVKESHRKKVDSLNLPAQYIVVHCQSNYAPKDWPAERWQQLIVWLSDSYNFNIIEIGLKSNLSLSLKAYQNLCGQLSILETAEVIRRANYLIGLDSGPSHLGNASDTFGIILMGALGDFPEYIPFSGRYGSRENAAFVRKKGLVCAELSFEYVRDEVEKVLKNRGNR